MKKNFAILLVGFILFLTSSSALAIVETTNKKPVAKSTTVKKTAAKKTTTAKKATNKTVSKTTTSNAIKTNPNARNVEFAFVFDGPSEKNAQVLETFKTTISKSLAPNYKAVFPSDLNYVANWTKEDAIRMSEKALKSRAFTVISLGYMSSTYLSQKKDNKKYVITIDEYGLRDIGSSAFFNPVKASVNDFLLFKKLVPTQHKTAILMNDNFYKTQKNWNTIIQKQFDEKNCDLEFTIIPINNTNVDSAISKISKDVDSVFVTPLFNLTKEQRKGLYTAINNKKLPSFSSLGAEDVELGALLGTSTPDVDRKLAEATSFNIHGLLHGKAIKAEKLPYYDEKVIFYNQDTGEILGYSAPLRLLNNAEIISHKELPKYDLSYVLNTLDESNLDIARKKYLVSAARRSVASAYLRYLPTLRLDLGYQKYNTDYARSYSDVPTGVGQFTVGMDQVIYSPDLVTNIIVKHKKLKFDKAESELTRQNLSFQAANLYVETLMLKNMIQVQEELLKETRENLAIAHVREKSGFCGKEEVLQWAGQVSEEEKKLLSIKADYKNIKITINKLLFKDQKEKYDFTPLTANDPAFFTSDIHIIDHVRTPEKLEKFTQMLIDQAIYLAPETTKLKAAIAMKKAEMGNYAQKFVLPNVALTLEHSKQFDRDLPYEKYLTGSMKTLRGGYGYGTNVLDTDSTRLFIGAEWKPIEGGHKIAEIARCKSELNELKTYLTEVDTEIEMNVREIINRAISKYFMIEKSYKAMFAQSENYQMVKNKYLLGKAPIVQLEDARDLYISAKLDALNSQYDFYKELLWVQRGLVSVNWTKVDKNTKDWIKKIPEILPAEDDFTL